MLYSSTHHGLRHNAATGSTGQRTTSSPNHRPSRSRQVHSSILIMTIAGHLVVKWGSHPYIFSHPPQNRQTWPCRCANGGMGLMLGEVVDEYTVQVIDVLQCLRAAPRVSTTSFRPRWSTCSNKQDVLRWLLGGITLTLDSGVGCRVST